MTLPNSHFPSRPHPSLRPLSLRTGILILASLSSCNSEPVKESAVDSALPGPERAAAAAARVLPLLTPALAEKDLKPGDPVFLRAFKTERILELWMRPASAKSFVLFRTYPVAATSGKIGPKLAEGDRQVPEGYYAFGKKHLQPASRYHLAFNVGYPNAYDRLHQRTGSLIMVHGSNVSIGCLAMTDPKIEEIYTLCAAAFEHGQPFVRIHIFPFRLTDGAIARQAASEWYDFWLNLKQGYDFFERRHIPPDSQVENGRYAFE